MLKNQNSHGSRPWLPLLGPLLLVVVVSVVSDIALIAWMRASVQEMLITELADKAKEDGRSFTNKARPGSLPAELEAQIDAGTDEHVREVAQRIGLGPVPGARELLLQIARSGKLLSAESAHETLAAQAPELVSDGPDAHARNAATLHLLFLANEGRSSAVTPDAPAEVGAADADAVARIDQVLADRLARAVAEKGLDATGYMPEQALRDAALASGSMDSDASRALLEAYRTAYTQLGLAAP